MKKIVVCLFLCLSLAAQDKNPANPKLKDSVALEIRTLQLSESQLQVQYNAIDAQLRAKLSTALKDSGLDDSKYQLDPTTLTVEEKLEKK